MVYIATYRRQSPDDPWPLDHGDDPSFGASQRLGARLTWGVCRPDVRSRLERGDMVIFFAADRLKEPKRARYQFVGFATVERSVRQTDLWRQNALKTYREYGNLVVRRNGARFEHFEPEEGVWHNDWLRRIAERHGVSREQFEKYEQRGIVPARIGRHPLHIGKNYVIFRPEPRDTFILAEPPVVAMAAKNGQVERWKTTRFATRLKQLVLGLTARSLRTTHPQRAHRHIRLDVPVEPLRTEIRKLCIKTGLMARKLQTAARPAPRPESAASRRRTC